MGIDYWSSHLILPGNDANKDFNMLAFVFQFPSTSHKSCRLSLTGRKYTFTDWWAGANAWIKLVKLISAQPSFDWAEVGKNYVSSLVLHIFGGWLKQVKIKLILFKES